MRHLFYCDTVGRLGSVGLLLLRLVMGAAFVLHGWPKIQNPFGWMGPEATMPGILIALAAVAEFGGGNGLDRWTSHPACFPGDHKHDGRGHRHGSRAERRPFRGNWQPGWTILGTGSRLSCLRNIVPALGARTNLVGRL
jgi:hypothetical protein